MTNHAKDLIIASKKIQDPIFNELQLQAIFLPTPNKFVKTRKGRGGKTFNYVEGKYVRNRLNQIFGWNWSFNVVDKFREGDEVVVQGRLVILNKKGEPIIVKEDFGCSEIQYLNDKQTKQKTDKPVSIGNDYKAATTDALKRCAVQIGIASDVYGDEFKTKNPISNITYNEEREENIKKFLADLEEVKDKDELADLIKKNQDLLKDNRVTDAIKEAQNV